MKPPNLETTILGPEEFWERENNMIRFILWKISPGNGLEDGLYQLSPESGV